MKYDLLYTWNIVSHNDQFIIFTLSSDIEGCIRELPASVLNNLSQAATCEIIELTRIYSTSWSFCFLLGSWDMTLRGTTGAWCNLHAHFFFIFHFYIFILLYGLGLTSVHSWSTFLRGYPLLWQAVKIKGMDWYWYPFGVFNSYFHIASSVWISAGPVLLFCMS